MKYKAVISVFLSVCTLCLFMFSACKPSKFFRKIEELYYVYWVDRDAGIELRQAVKYGGGNGSIIIDDIEYPISFIFTDPYDADYDCFIRFEARSEFALPSTEAECSIGVKADDVNNISQLRSGQSCTLFGRKYGQIVLEKQEMQETDFDAMDFVYDTSWTDENHELSFSMDSLADCYGSYSSAFYVQTEEGKQQVSFVWRPNNRFQIFKWDRETGPTETVAAEGTYESCGLNAVLHFEKDELWGRKGDLTLKGTLE